MRREPVRGFVLVALLVIAVQPATTDRPPGVEDDTLVDRDALADAHHDVLLSEGFVYRYERTVVPHDTGDATALPGNVTMEFRVEPNATAGH